MMRSEWATPISLFLVLLLILPAMSHAVGEQSDTGVAGSGGCNPGSRYDPSLPKGETDKEGKPGLLGIACIDTTSGIQGTCVAADECKASNPIGQPTPQQMQQGLGASAPLLSSPAIPDSEQHQSLPQVTLATQQSVSPSGMCAQGDCTTAPAIPDTGNAPNPQNTLEQLAEPAVEPLPANPVPDVESQPLNPIAPQGVVEPAVPSTRDAPQLTTEPTFVENPGPGTSPQLAAAPSNNNDEQSALSQVGAAVGNAVSGAYGAVTNTLSSAYDSLQSLFAENPPVTPGDEVSPDTGPPSDSFDSHCGTCMLQGPVTSEEFRSDLPETNTNSLLLNPQPLQDQQVGLQGGLVLSGAPTAPESQGAVSLDTSVSAATAPTAPTAEQSFFNSIYPGLGDAIGNFVNNVNQGIYSFFFH